MKIPARRIVLLHGCAEFRATVRSICGRAYSLQRVLDWESLVADLHSAPPTTVAVVDPFFAETTRHPAAVRSLLHEFPSVPVVAALRVGPDDGEDLLALAEAGVAEVIVIGHDDGPAALRARLEQVQSKPLRTLLDDLQAPDASGRARAMVDAAARVVAAGGWARDLARALGMGRRTLLRWTYSAALPPPRRLLAWMRILLAAHLLDDRGRTVLSVAHACGYSSDAGLRRVMVKFLGRSPTALRRGGRGFKTAAAAFKAVLADVRQRGAGQGAAGRTRRPAGT